VCEDVRLAPIPRSGLVQNAICKLRMSELANLSNRRYPTPELMLSIAILNTPIVQSRLAAIMRQAQAAGNRLELIQQPKR
jgi:hypothetical protein